MTWFLFWPAVLLLWQILLARLLIAVLPDDRVLPGLFCYAANSVLLQVLAIRLSLPTTRVPTLVWLWVSFNTLDRLCWFWLSRSYFYVVRLITRCGPLGRFPAASQLKSFKNKFVHHGGPTSLFSDFTDVETKHRIRGTFFTLVLAGTELSIATARQLHTSFAWAYDDDRYAGMDPRL